MGALANLQSNRFSFGVGSPLDRWATSELTRKIDPPIETAAAAKNEVQSMASATQTSGNMTLTFTIRQANGTTESFTTGNIAFNANAATVEGAIDTAATAASITGWTNGDVSVGGTAVNNGPLTFTFDGTSVDSENHPLVVLTDVDGAGGAWGAITQTTAGQSERPALSLLISYGVITSTIPEQGADASTSAFTKGSNPNYRIPTNIVKALMAEAAYEDNTNSTYISLEAAIMPQDRSPIVKPRTGNDGDVRALDV